MSTSQTEPPVVTVKQGRLQGHWKTIEVANEKPQIISEYLEIPYACPPIGNLRYQKPVPITKWEGIKVSPEKPTRAPPQIFLRAYDGKNPSEEMLIPTEKFSEDCLFLNVWSPQKKNPKNLLPVMVWIFGGGFITGSISLDLYNGALLSSLGDVVVVAVNYRLGPLGFMPIKDKNNPDKLLVANQGLWDQREALIWIQQNIEFFGGDPKNVCLFGESAGAMSVSLHMVSPQSKGLFHKAIMQSGTQMANWLFLTLDKNLRSKNLFEQELVKRYGDKFGKTPEEILQNIPFELMADYFFIGEPRFLSFSWAPCVDGDFLPMDSKKYVTENADKLCPFIVGVCHDEINCFYMHEDIDKEKKIIPENKLEKLFAYTHGTEIGSDLYKTILKHYSPDAKTVTHKILFESGSDRFFKGDTIRLVNRCKSTPCWMFHFSHRSSISTWPEWFGTNHGSEIEFVFGCPLKKEGYNDKDAKVSRDVINLWTNFAKFGDPSTKDIQWKKAWADDSKIPCYLDVTTEACRMKTDKIWAENGQFFEKLSSSKH